MNTYLVTATFKNVALMGAAYDLFLKVFEDGTLNDEFEGFKVLGRYHAPWSLEGWIVLKTDDPKAIYQHAAEWGEFLNWETTPVFTDEEAGPIVAKVYS